MKLVGAEGWAGWRLRREDFEYGAALKLPLVKLWVLYGEPAAMPDSPAVQDAAAREDAAGWVRQYHRERAARAITTREGVELAREVARRYGLTFEAAAEVVAAEWPHFRGENDPRRKALVVRRAMRLAGAGELRTHKTRCDECRRGRHCRLAQDIEIERELEALAVLAGNADATSVDGIRTGP